ncbi:MAG: thiol-activated cytolysin family protein [Bacteroidota bacterium]
MYLFKSQMLTFLFAASCILLTTCACNKNEDIEDLKPDFSIEEAMDFDTRISNLSGFTQADESNSTEQVGETETEKEGGYECFTTTYRAAPGFDQLLTLDPGSDVIYPGALLKGESISTGEYIRIAADRSPITLSASLTNINGSPVVEVKDPSLSTVREGVKSILNQEVTGATPAQINFEITQVYSEQQVDVAIGANYRSKGKQVGRAFDFSNTSKKNKFVLKYLQTYYTIDMDVPDNPSDLFQTLPDISSFGDVMPVYVASVAYGRMVIYTIETNSSETEINDALSASFASGDGTIDAKFQKTINESTIKAIVIGGSGASAAAIVNSPKEVYNYVAEGGNYSSDSPGAPLAYKLRFISKDAGVARVVLNTEYAIRNCEFAFPEYKLTLTKITSSQPTNVEVYGRLEMRMYSTALGDYLRDDPSNSGIDNVRWKKDKDDHVKVQNDKTYYMPSSYTYTIKPIRPNMGSDYIEFDGALRDSNGILGSVSLGDDRKKYYLKNLKLDEVKTVKLGGFDDQVDAYGTITRVQ